MNANSTRHLVVEPGGDQVAAHVGLHALGRFADAMALGEALSAAIPTNGRVLLHDRGKVVLQMMLMLAGGGEACTDIEHLRAQPELFGEVPSDSTVYRTFTEDLTPEVVEKLQAGFAEVRAKVWRKAGLTWGSAPVVLDIDSTLCEIHSENKEDTAPTYKGGFGFHPMLCFADATGEALSRASCARATPGPTTPKTTWACWTPPSPPAPRDHGGPPRGRRRQRCAPGGGGPGRLGRGHLRLRLGLL